MAKGIKTGGRNFPKGHKFATGRPPLPDDVKESRKLTQAELERCINKYLYLGAAELKKIYEKPSTLALDKVIIKIITMAITKGDHVRLDFVLNRVIGKVPEKMNMSGSLNSKVQVEFIGSKIKEKK